MAYNYDSDNEEKTIRAFWPKPKTEPAPAPVETKPAEEPAEEIPAPQNEQAEDGKKDGKKKKLPSFFVLPIGAVLKFTGNGDSKSFTVAGEGTPSVATDENGQPTGVHYVELQEEITAESDGAGGYTSQQSLGEMQQGGAAGAWTGGAGGSSGGSSGGSGGSHASPGGGPAGAGGSSGGSSSSGGASQSGSKSDAASPSGSEGSTSSGGTGGAGGGGSNPGQISVSSDTLSDGVQNAKSVHDRYSDIIARMKQMQRMLPTMYNSSATGFESLNNTVSEQISVCEYAEKCAQSMIDMLQEMINAINKASRDTVSMQTDSESKSREAAAKVSSAFRL